jgi:hypothetical protein
MKLLWAMVATLQICSTFEHNEGDAGSNPPGGMRLPVSILFALILSFVRDARHMVNSFPGQHRSGARGER